MGKLTLIFLATACVVIAIYGKKPEKYNPAKGVRADGAANPVHGGKSSKWISDTEKAVRAIDKMAHKKAAKKNPKMKDQPLPDRSGLDKTMLGDVMMTPKDACHMIDADQLAEDQELNRICQEAEQEEEENNELEQEQRNSGNGNGNGNGNGRKKRNVLDFSRWPNSRWTDGLVYYNILEPVSDKTRQVIEHAIEHWESKTCIRFQQVEGTLDQLQSLSFTVLLFQSDSSSGCWSYMGRTTVRPQPLNLGPNCDHVIGTAIHEIEHALGSYHEHTRQERDGMVHVHEEKIVSYALSNYAINTDSNSYGVPYDPASVMGYGPVSFRMGTDGYTMEALNPLYNLNMGQRQRATHTDCLTIFRAYQCEAQCPADKIMCLNDGYPNVADQCMTCHCPDGYGGADCSKIQGESGAACTVLRNNLVKRIRRMSRGVTITNPSWESTNQTYDHNLRCAWKISAANDNERLVFRFINDFHLPYNHATGPDKSCYHYLEFQDANQSPLNRGYRFCGTERPDPTDYDNNLLNVTFSHQQNSNTWFDFNVSSLMVNYDSTYTDTVGSMMDSTFQIRFRMKQ